ncbi:MAG: hypothetical protein KAY24_15905 [Candidatus Eisenbacteria sp.]|nr:hypothetical protein [Candidatus Eisenbacteria bacterium]
MPVTQLSVMLLLVTHALLAPLLPMGPAAAVASGPPLSAMLTDDVPASDEPSPTEQQPQPFSTTLAEDLRPRIVPGDDRLLILTPAALYRFQPASEAWMTTTPADGLPPAPLQNLSLTGENMWITGDGASVSDLRFDDWQRYGAGEGYPGRVVFDVEADEDYAYSGTDQGAGRFDQYILEWETLDGPGGKPLGLITDVAVGEDRVWFALERGIAEYRKETESLRVDSLLGQFRSPQILALRQSTRFLWALAQSGIARYDKELESWTSFQAGIELPDARVHQLTLQGDDLWLGTDAGLWRYGADTGIWRQDESGDEMPGESVLAFALEADRIWVVTERAFAAYEKEEGRWIDFTSSAPLSPTETSDLAYLCNTLILVGPQAIVYGLGQGQRNPSLFTYRSHPVQQVQIEDEKRESRWQYALEEEGLGVSAPSGASVYLKGGVTIYMEDDDVSKQQGETDLDHLIAETRLDLGLSGRLGNDRTLSGFYDSSDPDNTAYQLTFRGARSDLLRVVSAGEIEQQLFNSSLAPGTGLRGARARAEFGPRSEETRRRLLGLDAWIGRRRTLPGRDVFYGGNLTVEGLVRDNQFVRRQVFHAPAGWTAENLHQANIYLDDADASTDNANTWYGTLAERDGSWDRLRPNRDYVLGSQGRTLILAQSMGADQALVAVAGSGNRPLGTELQEFDLTDQWLSNHYWITADPVPGSLIISIVDSTGSSSDDAGNSYLQLFGLDEDADGLLEPDRFSPISGFLSFPQSCPFPPEVYAEDPANLYTIEYAYMTALNTFKLSHENVIPGSEHITIDKEPLRPDVDYSIIPSSGLFVFFEHVLLDDDTVIEIQYLYEVGENGDAADDATVLAGQLGLAPNNHLFLGMHATRWRDESGRDVTTGDVNTRLEWKGRGHFLRVSPELAFSRSEPQESPLGEETSGGDEVEQTDRAAAIGFQGRYQQLEVSASYRNLGDHFASFKDRSTLLGQLREESKAHGRLDLGRHVQAELEWNKALSDQITADSVSSRRGEESSLMGSLRLLRSGLPNLELRRGRVLLDSPSERREKWISRIELEINPDQPELLPWGINRLWVRAFFQRSERRFSASTAHACDVGAGGKRTTDHLFVRFNGSAGTPLSWNVAFEDQHTFRPEEDEARDIRRFQRIDATLQAQPHSSLDALLRWESYRNLFWHSHGESGGFNVDRLLLANIHLYPGRLFRSLSPLSFRIDLSETQCEQGDPAVGLPGASCLWDDARQISQRRQAHNGVVETRIQILSWMRLVERWEGEFEGLWREGLSHESDGYDLESRLEIKPRRGLLTLRVFNSRSTEEDAETATRRRFLGDWNQTWSRGILTYLSLDARRGDTKERALSDRSEFWNPQARITLRDPRWQLDTSLGISLSWGRSKDTSPGVDHRWTQTSRHALLTSLSFQPVKILNVKLQYVASGSRTELEGSLSSDRWDIDHDLRLRLLIRA